MLAKYASLVRAVQWGMDNWALTTWEVPSPSARQRQLTLPFHGTAKELDMQLAAMVERSAPGGGHGSRPLDSVSPATVPAFPYPQEPRCAGQGFAMHPVSMCSPTVHVVFCAWLLWCSVSAGYFLYMAWGCLGDARLSMAQYIKVGPVCSAVCPPSWWPQLHYILLTAGGGPHSCLAPARCISLPSNSSPPTCVNLSFNGSGHE